MSDPLDDLPPLREIIRRHELVARKSLGQNFLFDLNLTARIARSAGMLTGVTIFEVGPGPGGLTRALLALGAERVVAVEQDRRAIAALQEIAAHYPGRLDVVQADALTFDPLSRIDRGPARIVANLPYNIATALLVAWLSVEPWPPWYDTAVLMFQKEVAERITARPNQPAYGRLSVIAQAVCVAEIAMTLPARAFTPPPKVDSAVVQFTPRPERPPEALLEALQRVTAAAFGQRRKMLRSSLKAVGGAALWDKAGIDPSLRAEALSVDNFLALASGAVGA